MDALYYMPSNLEPGDQLAFKTKGLISWMIRLASPQVNHIETIATNPVNGKLEAFSARKDGVTFKPILDVIRDTDGQIRLHRLRQDVRDKLDHERMEAAINELDGVTYDYLHVIGVGIDDWHINLLGKIPKIPKWLIKTLKVTFRNSPSMKQAVCSAVWEWYVTFHGLGLDTINPSEETPYDSCRKKLFQPFQVLKGSTWRIPNYNTKGVL